MKHFFVGSFTLALLLIFVIFTPQKLFADEYIYSSKGKRDPFIPLIISKTRTSLGLQAVETIEDVKFEGVIFDPSGGSIAVLNNVIVKEGEKAYNVEVVKIYENAITIKVYNKSYTINLIEKGGETVER